MLPGRGHGQPDPCAEGVAEVVHALQPAGVQHRFDVAHEALHRVGVIVVRFVTAAMSAHVQRDHPVTRCEGPLVAQSPPGSLGQRRSVDQQQRFAAAGVLEGQPHAVVLIDSESHHGRSSAAGEQCAEGVHSLTVSCAGR